MHKRFCRSLRIVRPLVVAAVLALALAGCAKETSDRWQDASFDDAVKAARGTSVSFFMWGGSAQINAWIDGYVSSQMADRYDVTVNRVPMDASVFVNKLITEKQAGKATGSIDLLWINGENFKNARQADVLFGPFADRLPNVADYVDPQSIAYDFGYPVEGYEAPYGRAQFVFEYDSATVVSPPRTFDELLAWAKEHPGRFTYPSPPDHTGSAFIRQAFYATTGGYEQYLKGFDESLYEKNAPRLWDYLNKLKPYLWREGSTYPKDISALDLLFERGEVAFNMSYTQAHAQGLIIAGRYAPSVRTFVMQNNSIFNTHFTAIPFNAPNKPGAMVLANFLVSPDAQYSKNNPVNWGDFTALDVTRLDQADRDRFAALDLGEATLPFEVLGANAVPEIPSAYLELIERDWNRNVLQATDK